MVESRTRRSSERSRAGSLAFVVQKHQARALHYDFRLEIQGVLASWSVPKGPTLDNTVRRLAMPSGDHKMEHAEFEGVLGEDSGRAQAVIIWDRGTYNPEEEDAPGVRREVRGKAIADRVAAEGLKKGMLKFQLYGKRLTGSFALVRTAGLAGRDSWLLIKHKDASCIPGYVAADCVSSVVSNRTLAEVGSDQSTLF